MPHELETLGAGWANELADAMADVLVDAPPVVQVQQPQPPRGVVAGFSSEAELRQQQGQLEQLQQQLLQLQEQEQQQRQQHQQHQHQHQQQHPCSDARSNTATTSSAQGCDTPIAVSTTTPIASDWGAPSGLVWGWGHQPPPPQQQQPRQGQRQRQQQACPAASEMSAYELQRAANIAVNQRRLFELGLEVVAGPAKKRARR